jgi:predicted Zn-dependent protease
MLALAGIAVALAACQAIVPPDMQESAFRPSTKPVTVDNVTANNKLAELARAQHPRILATYGGEYSDPKLERMVAKVIGSLTTVSANPTQNYRITILNSPNVNAFALPGGYLYITRGLLALANDSSELAAVVAHEMGHVTANHGLQRQRLEAEEGLATKVVSDVLGDSPTAKAALIRGKLRLAQFSRNQELEADVIGIKSVGEAGYDPYAASRFLQSMSAYTDFRSVSGATDASLDFLATHPNTPQRIELALRHARQFGQPGVGTRDRDSYLAGIDGLLYGDTPDEGYVRGNNFLHPKLGISFSVPDGFMIDNSATAVTATGPGDMAVRFDGVSLDPARSLGDYIGSDRAGAGRGLAIRRYRDPRRQSGLPAAYGRPGREHFAGQRRARGRRLVPHPHPGREGCAEAAAHTGGDGEAGPDHGHAGGADGGRGPQARPLPGSERAWARNDAFGRRQGQDRHRQVSRHRQGASVAPGPIWLWRTHFRTLFPYMHGSRAASGRTFRGRPAIRRQSSLLRR